MYFEHAAEDDLKVRLKRSNKLFKL